MRAQDRNSMLFWLPRVLDAGVPIPRTEIVRIGHEPLRDLLDGKPLPIEHIRALREGASKVGYPLFMRTDQASDKHNWSRTCYVPSWLHLTAHLYRIIEFCECVSIWGLPYEAVMLREYIELDSAFRCFAGGLPISRERRYFVRDGDVECHHPYWPEDAIAEAAELRSLYEYSIPANWRDLLAELNRETDEEIALLSDYASRLGQRLPGYWSVDFARARNGTWFFIDAAEGEASWHPDCPHRAAKAVIGHV